MNTESGPIAMLVAVIWFGIGTFAVFTFFRHRRYVNSLPPSAGNLKLKRQHMIWLAWLDWRCSLLGLGTPTSDWRGDSGE